MRQIGLKKALMFSIMLLVAVSVAVSSVILYLQQKSSLTTAIINQSSNYVDGRAEVIEAMINEKVNGIRKISQQYKDQALSGTPDEIIELTKLVANAMNSSSTVIAFDNGDGYWNQATPSWPNHKYNGNVTERPWYQSAMRATDVTVTEPYQGTDGAYWVTIVNRIKGGAISVDLELSFLNKLVTPSADMPGAVAIILNHDTTLLASSSDAIKTGQKADQYAWFKQTVNSVVNSDSTMADYSLNGEEKTMFSHRISVGDKYWYYGLGLEKSVIFAELDKARNNAIIVTIIATVLCVFIAFSLVNVLYRPIILLRDTIQSLSSGNGDLTQRLAVKTDDDIGKISHGVNLFIASLQTMMSDVKDSTHSLHSSIGQLKNQAATNSDILQNHVKETEQIATAIEEMDATANSMATDAADTARLTEEANHTSEQSRAILSASQATVMALISDVETAVNDVQAMNDQTKNISTILSVIGDIAEQTNLLALNAAIEAARAGEQGRGFAVVADEVRSLATRTKESTEEIEQAIESLLRGSQRVVKSMDETKARCQETATGSEEVSQSLDTLIAFIGNISALSTQIATAAEEQSCVTKEVSRNMSAISEIVQELDQSGQHSLENTASIEQTNNALVSIVGRFKI
ncbi:methyl-accepting chemotaxis protein [Shewanella sp.]|uniref:methyl-accepting chemotaxis protein n=1 Tax=Shewanella sp. TaxID=50422 RepID=UPI003A974A07